MTQLLGGAASPIGWSVQYLQAPATTLVEALVTWRRELGHDVEVRPARVYPDVLHDLLPFEAPWTRELVMPCGDGWTAYLNNRVDGGDPTAYGPAMGRRLDVRCVVAQHSPRHGPGHQGTQLWVMGPDGEPPLMYERAIWATAADSRWEWGASGRPFAFEDQARYSARRIRDRFDRPLLLEYLRALGIPADDDDAAYGPGVVLQQHVDWPRRTESLEEARRSLTG